ncbi:MAG: hypothetical protein C0392_04915 [Syntrophus sp. (in: bacteria)]|nr:hypothetical protein [Syntrophus sp. (in: bacteria)]
MDSSDNISTGKKDFKIKRKIIIEPDMFYSKAFKDLSATALWTLMRCLQKRTWKYKDKRKTTIVYTDDGFIFPYSEAEALGIGTTQCWKNIKTLVNLGFLDIVHQGGWYQKKEKQKDYSVYKLSDRWKLYGEKNFQPGIKPKVLQSEFYIRKNLEKQKSRPTSLKRSGQLHKSEGDRGKRTAFRLLESEVDKKQAELLGDISNAV